MPSDGLHIEVGANTNKLKSGLKEAKSSIFNFGRAIETAIGFSAAGAISKMVDWLKTGVSFAIQMSAKFEDLGVIFGTIIGDAGVAGKVMQDLRTFSVKTPFTPEEVFKASKSLLAFGFAAKEQVKLVKMLGDASAVTNKPLDEMAFIYGKIFARGNAQMRELNQLLWAGVPILKVLQSQLGKNRAEIFEMSRQGKISFSMIEKAFESMSAKGGVFYQGAERRARTLSGRYSTLKGVVMELGAAFGDMASPAVMMAMDLLIGRLEKMTKFAKAAADSFNDTFGVGGDMGFSLLEKGLLTVLSTQSNDELKKMFADQERWVKEELANRRKQAKAAAAAMPDRAPRMGAEDGMPKDPLGVGRSTLSSSAQQGLFNFLPPLTSDIPTMQLQEQKKTNEILTEIKELTPIGNQFWHGNNINKGRSK